MGSYECLWQECNFKDIGSMGECHSCVQSDGSSAMLLLLSSYPLASSTPLLLGIDTGGGLMMSWCMYVYLLYEPLNKVSVPDRTLKGITGIINYYSERLRRHVRSGVEGSGTVPPGASES